MRFKSPIILIIPVAFLIVAALGLLIQSGRINHPGTPMDTTKTTNNQRSGSEWSYPNSRTTSSTDDKGLTLQSSDDPGIITNWYKDKITVLGLRVKTFVTTKSNGNILNKLAGSSGQKNISVEIQKEAGESSTQINVKLD